MESDQHVKSKNLVGFTVFTFKQLNGVICFIPDPLFFPFLSAMRLYTIRIYNVSGR
jgi:hypothetical protein